MKQEIDIVYPLGSGSRWQNNEIRYSLRSVETCLKGYGNIYIVGQKPIWLENVIHIKADDPLRYNADGNITLKVLKACENETLSNPFLFINDDHIFLKEIHILDIPNYYKGDLSLKQDRYYEGGLYMQRLKRTRDVLRKKNLPTLHFDCHTPILIDKELFPKVINRFDFRKDIGYGMKSLYANSLFLEGEYRQDLNIKSHHSLSELNNKTEDRTIMAFNDRGLNGDLKKFLSEKFPNFSKYEDMNKNKQLLYTEAIHWLDAENKSFSKGRYDEGVRIYCELGRNRHLMGLIRRERTERFLRAIEKELRIITRKMKQQGVKPVQIKKKPVAAASKKPVKKQAEKKVAVKSTRPRFNTNDYVDPNVLPEDLREKFEENKQLIKQIAGLHAEMKAFPQDHQYNDNRKDHAELIVKMEKKKDANWQEIDRWWKQKDQEMKVTKPSGALTKEQIERIQDEGVRALSKDLRIKANLRYIARYGASEKERQQEQIRLRQRELQDWGVNH